MEKYKYVGPTMLIGSNDEHELREGMFVDAEVNINIATITALHKGDSMFAIATPVDVAAKYLDPVRETIDFKEDEHPWYWYENELAEMCYGQQLQLVLEYKPNGFIVIQVLNGSEYVLLCTNNNADESNVSVFKRAYEDLRWKVEYGGVRGLNSPIKPLSEEVGRKLEEYYTGKDNIEVGGQHYQTAIQPWDFIYANGLDFDSGNIVKYASRHKKKGGAEDVKKIISYAKHILKTQYGEEV